jgi:hypothetical protein
MALELTVRFRLPDWVNEPAAAFKLRPKIFIDLREGESPTSAWAASLKEESPLS